MDVQLVQGEISELVYNLQKVFSCSKTWMIIVTL